MIDLGVLVSLDLPFDYDLFPLPFLPLDASYSLISKVHVCQDSSHSVGSFHVASSSHSAGFILGFTRRLHCEV